MGWAGNPTLCPHGSDGSTALYGKGCSAAFHFTASRIIGKSEVFHWASGSQLGVILPSRGHWAMSGGSLSCHNWGLGDAVCIRWVETGMQLNSLLYTWHPTTTKNYSAQNVNSAEAEKPWLRNMEMNQADSIINHMRDVCVNLKHKVCVDTCVVTKHKRQSP